MRKGKDFMFNVLGILIDKQGKTLGAKIKNVQTGVVFNVKTEEIKESSMRFDNAIVDKNGYVRSNKAGKSFSRFIMNVQPKAIEQQEQFQVNRLLITEKPMLYHGTKDVNLVPTYGKGNKANDYGLGFYTTPNVELAKEWAWSGYTKGDKAYVYAYEVNFKGYNVLDLTKLDSIHWIAELVAHRDFNVLNERFLQTIQENKKRLLSKYKLDTREYDIIIGYRADDCYFSYAEYFVAGLMYKSELDKAMRLGELGVQVCIKSQKAFDLVKNPISVNEVPKVYEQRFKNRDKAARNKFYESQKQKKQNNGTEKTIYDYING